MERELKMSKAGIEVEEDQLLTVEQASRLLRKSSDWIYDQVQSAEKNAKIFRDIRPIPYYRFGKGGQVRFSREELLKWGKRASGTIAI